MKLDGRVFAEVSRRIAGDVVPRPEVGWPRLDVVQGYVPERGDFAVSLTRADFATLGKDAPVLVQRSGPFKGRVYQRTPTGGIVRVK